MRIKTAKRQKLRISLRYRKMQRRKLYAIAIQQGYSEAQLFGTI
jgi:hypothetical protein